MLNFFKKDSLLLIIKIGDKEICRVNAEEVPCEKCPTIHLEPHQSVNFIDSHGVSHAHSLGGEAGWYHFSMRVHQNLACQSDCVVTKSEKFDPEDLTKGHSSGIRFQPFFLSGAKVPDSEFRGRGLFFRGMHFNGTVTPGNVLLSCECDHCKKSFLIRSYHSGFSNAGYFYSGSGRFTIIVPSDVPGCPVALTIPNPEDLFSLEARLPKAPDGSEYRYLNSFRCPHCSQPFIDFEKYPKERQAEYYGNYLAGSELVRYDPSHG